VLRTLAQRPSAQAEMIYLERAMEKETTHVEGRPCKQESLNALKLDTSMSAHRKSAVANLLTNPRSAYRLPW
jgi:hypothetical protein